MRIDADYMLWICNGERTHGVPEVENPSHCSLILTTLSILFLPSRGPDGDTMGNVPPHFVSRFLPRDVGTTRRDRP